MDPLALLRWPVILADVACLIVFAFRWRWWLAASPMWRLVALSLAMNIVATLIGATTALMEGRPGGGQVPAYLLAALVALWALTNPTPRPTEDTP